MRTTIRKMMNRYGAQLCAFALALAPLVSERCRFALYEPKEPEGFADFVKEAKRS